MPDPSNVSNPFLALASALWKRGEDGEVLARELAQALHWIIKEGEPDREFHSEIDRLLKLES